MEQLKFELLKILFVNSYSQETSFTPDLWSKENPFIGQTANTALLAQDIIGGIILRGKIPEGWQEIVGYHCHYINVLKEGEYVDFTRERFPKEFPYSLFLETAFSDLEDKREYLLNNPDTQIRYNLLKRNFQRLKTY
jgi:hypothetical protein